MLCAILATAVLTASPEFAFAFSNEAGDRLIALSPLSAPGALTRVSCDGAVLWVKYEAEQPAGPKSTGRQTARNFSQVQGSIFKLQKGTVTPDAVCLLGTEAAFAARKRVSVAPTDVPCDEKAAALATKLGKRKVTKCLATGEFPGGKLLFARFATQGSGALVGVILDGESTGIRAFPATLVKDAPSCWRVDDGCEFDPKSYRVLFVMTGPQGPELFALWGGAESENAELLRLKGGALMPAISASRYWSPE